MKRLCLIILFFLFIPSYVLAETFIVITKENTIREYPRFFAPIKAYVRYGDMLNAIGKEGDWYRVNFRNVTGYIHKTAVEQRTSTPVGSFSSRTGATQEEITLAGKGFNPQVESAYRAKNPQFRYDLVEKVEKYDVSDAELFSFIRAGGLKEPK